MFISLKGCVFYQKKIRAQIFVYYHNYREKPTWSQNQCLQTNLKTSIDSEF